MRLSRRSTLALIGGGTLAVAGGAAFVATLSDEELVRRVLEHHLGPFEMEEDEMAAFVAGFREQRGWMFPAQKLSILYGTAARFDMSEMTYDLPGNRGADIERFERQLLGEFHLLTDVGLRASPETPVYYLGPTACLNPFATFA